MKKTGISIVVALLASAVAFAAPCVYRAEAAVTGDGTYAFTAFFDGADSLTATGASFLLDFDVLPVAGGVFEANIMTASYNFKNNSASDSVVSFTVPAGAEPAYAAKAAEPEETGVYVNDAKINADVRYTYWQNARLGYADIASEKLKMRPKTDIISPQTPVTCLKYRITCDDAYNAAYLSADISHEDGAFIITDMRYSDYVGPEVSHIGDYIYGERETYAVIYVSGAPEDISVRWSMAKDYTSPDYGYGFTVSCEQQSVFTFAEFVTGYVDAPEDISDDDRYNAVADMIMAARSYGNVSYLQSLDLTGRLMRWFTGEFSVAAGKEIAFVTKTPIYPYINSAVSGGEYECRILMSSEGAYGDMTFGVRTDRSVSASADGEDVTAENGKFEAAADVRVVTVTISGDGKGGDLIVPDHAAMINRLLVILAALLVVVMSIAALVCLVKSRKSGG